MTHKRLYFNPESALGILWERGYRVRLASQELNVSHMDFEIDATREEVKDCLKEDHRRVRQYHELDRPYHREVTERKSRDYDASRTLHRTRVYFHPEQITATLHKHGITPVVDPRHFTHNRAIVLRNQPHHCFLMVNALCEYTRYRAAQFEWLRKLCAEPPEPIRMSMEVDLL